jgi:hypothetical protein
MLFVSRVIHFQIRGLFVFKGEMGGLETIDVKARAQHDAFIQGTVYPKLLSNAVEGLCIDVTGTIGVKPSPTFFQANSLHVNFVPDIF